MPAIVMRATAHTRWRSSPEGSFVGRVSFADLLVLGSAVQTDVRLMLHAMEVAIENAGGEAVRVSSAAS